MAFATSYWSIPTIYGYDQAEEMFHKDTPIRGGDQSIRRFVSRNDKTKWLKHEIKDGVDVYTAGLHRSGLVSFYPTHYEITMDGWSTQSTIHFIRGVIGRWVSRVNPHAYIPKGFNVDLPARYEYMGWPITAWDRYKFGYDHTPLEPEKHPTLVKYKVNRKRMNEVRKVVKPFYDYMVVMDNLLDIDVSGEKSSFMSGPYENTNRLVEDIENQENWWDMFQCLAWQTSSSLYTYSAGKMEYRRNINAMKRKVDAVLKWNNPQVLDVVK